MRENRLQPNLDPHMLARDLSNRLLIDGTLRPALSGRRFAVINPATGETIAEAAEGAAADVAVAVDAATRAQKIWAKTASRERATCSVCGGINMHRAAGRWLVDAGAGTIEACVAQHDAFQRRAQHLLLEADDAAR